MIYIVINLINNFSPVKIGTVERNVGRVHEDYWYPFWLPDSSLGRGEEREVFTSVEVI